MDPTHLSANRQTDMLLCRLSVRQDFTHQHATVFCLDSKNLTTRRYCPKITGLRLLNVGPLSIQSKEGAPMPRSRADQASRVWEGLFARAPENGLV